MTLAPTLARARLLVVPVIAAMMVAVPAPTSASDQEERAAEIVATAPEGEPLKVVVTRRAADGTPVISTVVADTRSKALSIVARALGRAGTIGAEMDQRVSIAAYNDTHRSKQWALNALKAESVHQSTKGGGVTVAVVDTGIKSSHADLDGRVLSGVDYVDPGTSPKDTNGHGTHVSGIIAAVHNNRRGIAGFAPKAKILPVRVLGRHGSGSSSNVAKGILYATSHGAKVINLSLEGGQASTAIRSAIENAIQKNVLVVASAGNGGCGLLGGGSAVYPAAYPGVVGVGAVTRSLSKASYSSCGSHVDVMAPGDGIISTMIRNSVDLGCSSRADYCTLSGTSMAAPYTSAAAALAIARRGWSQSTVAQRLESTAQDLGTRGKDKATGSGFINPSRLINP